MTKDPFHISKAEQATLSPEQLRALDIRSGKMIVDNVRDGRRGYTGSWLAEPLLYDALGPEHVGRTVIYRDHGRAEAGTITSWRGGTVFARYSRGDTAAGANAIDLVLGIRALDTPEEIIAAHRAVP